MNKSAMQELIDKIDKNELFGSGWRDRFLEKEKQQIIDAYSEFGMPEYAEQYYNETYSEK